MKFRIKNDVSEPVTVEARNAWDALRIGVNGHLKRVPELRGDFFREGGVITAAIWRTGQMYHIRPVYQKRAGGLQPPDPDRRLQTGGTLPKTNED